MSDDKYKEALEDYSNDYSHYENDCITSKMFPDQKRDASHYAKVRELINSGRLQRCLDEFYIKIEKLKQDKKGRPNSNRTI